VSKNQTFQNIFFETGIMMPSIGKMAIEVSLQGALSAAVMKNGKSL
jgi:hypothetical protein